MEHVLKALSGWLVQQDAIEPEDRELYEYAMYSFLVSVMPLAIFLIASGVTGMLPEGLLILLPFMFIRKFSGGYHAKHAYTCLFISVGLLSICLFVVVYVSWSWIFHVLAVVSGVSVMLNSPIDSENKKLEADEMNEYRRTTCLLVIITMVSYFVLLILNQGHYALCLAISLALTAMLQLPCIVKKKK